MRLPWIAGVLHAMIGASVFFATLHPLRDALTPHGLELARIGGAYEAIIGLAVMIAAAATNARIATLVMAGGAALSCAVIYMIAATDQPPPFIVAAPIGGAITFAGWIMLLLTRPKD